MSQVELFSRDTRAFVYGAQLRATQRMLDFDTMCRRDTPSVAGIITPERGGFEKFFWGTKEIVIHRFRTIRDAVAAHPEADTVVNFASERSAYASTKEMLERWSNENAQGPEDALLEAAKAVLAHWEHGDLAAAARQVGRGFAG